MKKEKYYSKRINHLRSEIDSMRVWGESEIDQYYVACHNGDSVKNCSLGELIELIEDKINLLIRQILLIEGCSEDDAIAMVENEINSEYPELDIIVDKHSQAE